MKRLGRLWRWRTMRHIRRRRYEIEKGFESWELSDVDRWIRFSVEPERRRREARP